MTDDREYLRRIAFGPDATAKERAAAEVALRQLDEEAIAAADALAKAAVDAQNASEPDDEASVEVAGDNDDGESDVDADADESDELVAAEPFWQRSIRLAWVVPIVVGAIVVGYFGSLGPLAAVQHAAGSRAPVVDSSWATVMDFTEGEEILGDLQAADRWFDSPDSSGESYPFEQLLKMDGVNPMDVRLAVYGGKNESVWVARTEGEFCLLSSDMINGTGSGTCVTRDDFEQSGVSLSSGRISAQWYGREVITDPPLVDPNADAQGWENHPGDMDAANAFLGSKEKLKQDVFDEGELSGMGVDLVGARIIAPEAAPWISLLIAKQRAGGFCLVLSDGGTMAKCSTIEEFRSEGLSLGVSGYLFQWDGNSLRTNRLP